MWTQQKVLKMKCKKTKFATLQQAENIIKRAWRGDATWRGKDLPRRAYQCLDCGRWHLTSKPLMTRAQLIERSQSQSRSMA